MSEDQSESYYVSRQFGRFSGIGCKQSVSKEPDEDGLKLMEAIEGVVGAGILQMVAKKVQYVEFSGRRRATPGPC